MYSYMISVQSICACLTALVLIRYLLDGIGELVIGAPATHVNFGGALRRPREFVHNFCKRVTGPLRWVSLSSGSPQFLL